MAYFQRYERTITTGTGGGGATGFFRLAGATATRAERLSGYIHEVYYKPSATGTRFASTVDFTWTREGDDRAVFSLGNVTASVNTFYAPRQKTFDATGGEAKFATGGTNVQDRLAMVAERMKITVASGGTSKTGTFGVIVGG